MSPLQRGAVAFCVSLLAASACLTGCSATPAGIGAALSARLQNDVREVAQLTAAHRYPEARTALATMRRTASASVAAGTLSPERAKRIQAAVDLVVADLTAAQAPTKAPAPAPTPATPQTPAASPTAVATAASTEKQHERVQKWLEHWTKRAEEAAHRDEEAQQEDDGDD